VLTGVLLVICYITCFRNRVPRRLPRWVPGPGFKWYS